MRLLPDCDEEHKSQGSNVGHQEADSQSRYELRHGDGQKIKIKEKLELLIEYKSATTQLKIGQQSGRVR